MKRVRCPKCDQYITFDETQYEAGQSLVFKCPDCGKEFGIRMGVSKLRNRQKDENPDEQANEEGCGSIVVIENVFHYKQVIPLRMGDNVIGRYQKGNPANCTFETVDPSVDLNHCTITVQYRHFRRQRGTLPQGAPHHRRRHPLHPRRHQYHPALRRQRGGLRI